MKKGHVLIIDDNSSFSRTLKVCALTDYAVTIETDSTKAVATAKQAMPDVVLLDCVMPKMDGFDVLQAFRADPGLMHIPVLMYFPFTEAEISKWRPFPERISVEAIHMPIDPEELKLRIEKVISAAPVANA